jgi:hypothetical protein
MRKHYFLLLPVLIACFSMQVSAQVNLQQGLVAYYPFNGNANDESGNGNHGILHNISFSVDRHGNSNSAISFNGVNSRINLNANLHASGFPLTYSYWINPDLENMNNPYNIYTLISGEITQGSWDYYYGVTNQNIKDDGRFNFAFGNGLGGNSTNRRSFQTNQNVFNQSGEWYHIVLIVNNFSTGGHLYVNNQEVPFNYFSGTASSVNFNNGNYVLGCQRENTYPYLCFYLGIMDDIRVYSRQLNIDEIYALFTEGQPPQTNTISNILINQRNDGSGIMDVYFNLNCTGGQYNITLEASFDGENTYTAIPASFLSGDVSNVSPGTNKHIVWDGLGSHPNTYSTATKLKITAN